MTTPESYIGRAIDYDGSYGNQCMDLILQYCEDNGLPRPTGNAKDVFGQLGITWVQNTPTGVPPAGSIVVWGTGIGPYGHIAIARAGSTPSKLLTVDQNWNGHPYVEAVTHNYNSVMGWGIINAGTPAGGEDMINQGANEYARANKLHLQVRGRPLEKSVFDQFVGSTWLHYIEVLSDDPEAEAIQHNQDVGAVAVRDKWDQQIYSLQDQLKKATDLANTLNDRLVKSENSTKTLTAQVEALNKKVAELDNQDNIVVSRGFFNSLFDKIKNIIGGNK